MQNSRATDAGRQPAANAEAEPQAPPGEQGGERSNELSAELERLEDRYKRALADLDNYRKRSARELERRVQEARESLIRDWLEAVDSVERALRMEPEGNCAEGLRAVLDQMEAVLERAGDARGSERSETGSIPSATRRSPSSPRQMSRTARSSRSSVLGLRSVTT